MGYETQTLDLCLKTHFKKQDMKLQEGIWVSKNIFKNRIRNSKSGFESQRTVLEIGYETQRWDMSLKEHLKNGIWNSKDGFESQRTFYKIGYKTQRRDMSFKEHFKTWDMKLKGWIWVSKNIFKNGIWNSKVGYESQRTF